MPSSERKTRSAASRVSRGLGYEKAAEKLFSAQGFEIIERNWRAGHKEIDLIVRKNNLIVFVEVKSSRSEKYGHPIYLLETFVERDRFRGICYQAGNWTYAGQTKGRSRNDRYTTLKVPVKDIYLYPLTGGFREALSHEA